MDARVAANYMLYIMGDAFDDLTNMKINKLLYFAQGYYLKKYGVPMFPNTIEAWEHGPVIPEVYFAYRSNGDRGIRGYDEAALAQVTPEAEGILYGVAREYGRYTAGALRSMTHVIGSPWDQVYEANRAHIAIPLSIMRDYFAELAELNPAEKQFKESDFVGRRDEDGILVLPKEWDDGEV